VLVPSDAITRMVQLPAEPGVPLKVRVAALKLSHAGSATPLASAL
jgi:hypothetical protein